MPTVLAVINWVIIVTCVGFFSSVLIGGIRKEFLS